jgi:sec-independent protein translocase protein TatB
MFDLGWTELLVIGIVALIVVGPKDLPMLFRNVGRFVGKAKGMAREFSRAMNDAADESGVRDIAKGLKSASNPVGSAMDGFKDAARDMGKAFDPTKLDPDSETGKLAKERSEQAKKIQAATARAAAERKAKEAAEAMKKAEEYEAELNQPAPDAPGAKDKS